jgi:uncharacterized protein YukE
MLDFAGIAGQLQTKLGGLTDETRNNALATIFGTDAVRSASVLYAQGADGIQAWTDKTNDAGYAAETARLKLDNLSGDVEKLGGSFDTALIKGGSAANASLRGVVQAATSLVDGFNDMDPVVQGGVVVIAALTAGVLLLGGGLVAVVPKIVATRAALSAMELSGKRVAGVIGKGGAVLAAVAALTAGLAGMGQTSQLAAEQIAYMDASIKTGNMDALNKQFKAGATTVAGMTASLKALKSGDFFANQQGNVGFGKFMAGLGIDVFYKDLRNAEAQFKQLGSTLATTSQTDFKTAAGQFNQLAKAAGGTKETTRELLDTMPDYKAALIDLAAAQGETLSEQELLSLAQGKGAVAAQVLRDADAKAAAASAENASKLAALSGAAQDANIDIGALAESIKGFGSAQLDVNSATRGFEAAIDDLSKSIADNGNTLDVTNEKGRANQAAVDAWQSRPSTWPRRPSPRRVSRRTRTASSRRAATS